MTKKIIYHRNGLDFLTAEVVSEGLERHSRLRPSPVLAETGDAQHLLLQHLSLSLSLCLSLSLSFSFFRSFSLSPLHIEIHAYMAIYFLEGLYNHAFMSFSLSVSLFASIYYFLFLLHRLQLGSFYLERFLFLEQWLSSATYCNIEPIWTIPAHFNLVLILIDIL